MAWIESHQEIGRHPKTRKAARLLGVCVPQVVGHIHLLWHWALDFAETGDVTSFEAADLADAAMWEGDPTVFVESLQAAGWLSATETGGLVIHDWNEYAGRLLEQREANAQKQRAWRAKQQGHVTVTVAEPRVVSPDTAPLRNGYVTVTEPSHDTLTVTVTEPSTIKETTPLPPKNGANQPAVAPIRARGAPPLPADRPAPVTVAVPRPCTPVPKGFDFPGLWATVERDQGYPLAWNYAVETKAVKRLLTAYPSAQPADLARFLTFVRHCWPFSAEPTRQPTFSQGAAHFGAWYTGGQPAIPAPGESHARTAAEKRGDSFREWGDFARGLLASGDPGGEPGPRLRLIGPDLTESA